MMLLNSEIPGAAAFIRAIDEAVSCECQDELTSRLRHVLCQFIRSGELRLPECVNRSEAGHYARRVLYLSERHGYSVMAMTWGPGQGTPIHDHSGMWCVEGVLCGEIEVTQYQLDQHDDDRFHFTAIGTTQAGPGSAGSLIPPFEYHTIGNPDAHQNAVTIHVYSGEMTCCNIFEHQADSWYQRVSRDLAVTQDH